MTQHPAPSEIPPARLAALAKLPIFLDLAGKRVVLAGGGEASVWKAELLFAAGARVEVFAATPIADLVAFAATSAGAVTLIPRDWREDDLDGAVLAVAEEEGFAEGARFAEAARARGILVNVIDRPAHGDFQFGTIVNRSPVVIGISTDGAAPILGQAIRRRIEAVLPPSLGVWAAAARAFRDRLKARVESRAGRRRFWEAFVDLAFAAASSGAPPRATLDRLADEARDEQAARAGIGEVIIVGAGPGDPELLTMKAVRELQAADVVVFDRLVTPPILELARREARRIHVGKEGHGAACRQEDISALLVDLALEGQRVLRLKGGDPAIFGRTGEETAACRAAGVPVRIVPGVTTASAAAAALGVSLTHRDHAQRLQFVTGHDRHGALPADLDLAALADPRATVVVYMGRRTIRALTGRLLAEGLAPGTPAAVVMDVSRPTQAALATTVGDLAQGLAMPPGAPVIVLIGAALAEGGSGAEEAGSRPVGVSNLVA